MSIDRTGEVTAEMLINRLELTDQAVLVFEEGDDVTGYEDRASFTNGGPIHWDAVERLNAQNKSEFIVVRVLDYAGFEAIERKCDTVRLEGYRYTFEGRFKPKGATRIWTYTCKRNGERTS